jgi:hypothetical protein
MESLGELAILHNDPSGKVLRSNTRLETKQSGAYIPGSNSDEPMVKYRTSNLVLDSLASLSSRLENIKKRRLCIELSGSIKSSMSTCNTDSINQLSTVAESLIRSTRTRFSKSSSSEYKSGATSSAASSIISSDISYLHDMQQLVRISKRSRLDLQSQFSSNDDSSFINDNISFLTELSGPMFYLNRFEFK